MLKQELEEKTKSLSTTLAQTNQYIEKQEKLNASLMMEYEEKVDSLTEKLNNAQAEIESLNRLKLGNDERI